MILRKAKDSLNSRLTETERRLGIDLKLTEDNDLQVTNLKDLKLVTGAENAAQAAKLKLFIEPGGLQYHLNIGTDLQVGSKTKSAFDLQEQIIRSLSSDPRFASVEAQVEVINNVVVVNVRLVLRESGIAVPLQFAVLNG